MKDVIFYTLDNGDVPVKIWLDSLDAVNRARIFARLARVQEGNLGDFKKIDSDISELRFMFGSGYRV